MVASPGEIPTSLVTVKFPDIVVDAARRRASALKRMTENRGGCEDCVFLHIDPNSNPALWEIESGKFLQELIGPSVRELHSAFRLTKNVLHIKGLAAEYLPPSAPYKRQSNFSEIPTTLINVFGIVSLMNGCSFAYATENGGRVVRDVVAREDARNEYSSQGWGCELPWHMDGAFRPLTEDKLVEDADLSPAPRWLVFGVIYDSPRVPLTFVSLDEVLNRLSQRAIDALSRPEFDVRSPASFIRRQVTSGASILLPDEKGGYFSRFNQITCFGTTPAARKALEALSEVLREPEIRYYVDLTAGDVVVLDNWRSLHMRSAYLPRWDGTDRWLVRIYMAPSQRVGIAHHFENPRIWK